MIAVIVFLVLVLGWVLVSGRLTARSITGPIALTVAGFLLARIPGASSSTSRPTRCAS